MADTGPGEDAAAGLAAALRLDATLARQPDRLRRALADLAPHDDRGAHLVVLGAELGIPDLLTGGLAAEAYARLADLGGCRADSVAWTVAAWASGLGMPAPVRPAGDGPEQSPPGDHPAEAPGPVTSLHLAAWPDGGPAVGVLTLAGAFVLADAREPAEGRWRRVATPHAPLSRDIALALGTGAGEVVWSDSDGVRSRAVRRPPAGHAGGASLGEPRLLAAPPGGGQARYPLTALMSGPGSLDVIWTADRQVLHCWQTRGDGGADSSPLPLATASGERLSGLDVAAESERTARMVCVTDRGRVLLAHWDLAFGSHAPWQVLDPPGHMTAAAIATLPGGTVIVAATSGGNLVSAPAVPGGAWRSIDRPAEIRGSGQVRALSAAAAGDDGWLAVAVGADTWLMPFGQRGGLIECGPPQALWLGG